jgi:hypothetical protein
VGAVAVPASQKRIKAAALSKLLKLGKIPIWHTPGITKLLYQLYGLVHFHL